MFACKTERGELNDVGSLIVYPGPTGHVIGALHSRGTHYLTKAICTGEATSLRCNSVNLRSAGMGLKSWKKRRVSPV